MKPIFEVHQVRKSFGGLVAVDNVSFELYPGEILGIIGPNGAGKSTLFNLLAGAMRPDSGQVRFEDQNVSGKKDYELCRLGIARTFQIVKPFRDLTVLENVMAAAFLRIKDKQKAKEFAIEMIEKMKLGSKTYALAGSLTLPEMKRLEVTRALATNPKVLMLDEVLAGLNPSEVAEMVPIIRSIVDDGKTSILIIEHVLYALMSLAHRVIVINQGKLIKVGTPEEVVNDPEVIRIYLGEDFSLANR